jgi:hypothetical protein
VITDLLADPDLIPESSVLWIDNIHEYLDRRNGSEQRLLGGKEVADWLDTGGRIMGTIWDSRYADYEANVGGRESGPWEVVRQGSLIRMESGRPSSRELGLAGQLYDLDLSRGIGETFKVVDQLVTRLYDSIGESPEAYALVRIGVDWYQCGMGQVVPEAVLRDLLPEYCTDAGIAVLPDSFDKGILWAQERVLRTASLLERGGDGFSVSDVIRYKMSSNVDELPRLTRNVREDTWAYVFAKANERELINVGNAAISSGRLAVSLDAYSQAAARYASIVNSGQDDFRVGVAAAIIGCGVALWRLGRLEEAIEAFDEAKSTYRQLIESFGDDLRSDVARAFLDVGNALRGWGRLEAATEAYDEAISIYQQLVESGRDDLRSDLARAILTRGT